MRTEGKKGDKKKADRFVERVPDYRVMCIVYNMAQGFVGVEVVLGKVVED